jgi:S1-C subfamily serine protease
MYQTPPAPAQVATDALGGHGQHGMETEVRALAAQLRTLQQQHQELIEHVAAIGQGAAGRAGAANGSGSPDSFVPPAVLRTVVKVFAAVAGPNHILPWQRKLQTNVSGTGFVVDKKRRLLMTNTHVIGKATSIQIRRHGAGHRHVAEVVFIAADADLALLRVPDDDFWADVEEAQFEGVPSELRAEGGVNALCALGLSDAIPDLQASVKVVGFPWGGDQVSITSGVVSRVDMTSYGGADAGLLAIQIDAAINMGNSGGPALVDSKVIGIAFQTLVSASNIGYLIPACVAAVCVRAFVAACAQHAQRGGVDEHVHRVIYHHGFATVGVGYQDMTNTALRAQQGFKTGQTGCLVEHVFKRTSAEGYLKEKDVIMSINGMQVADDATVQWKPDQRVCFSHFIRSTKPGDNFTLGIWRDGKELTVEIPAKVPFALMPNHTYTDRYREVIPYRVFGGCIFTELTMGYLYEWGESDWVTNSPRYLQLQMFPQLGKDESRESVAVLSQILPHAVNRGYASEQFTNRMVHSINGETVKSFDQMNRLLDAAIASGEETVTLKLSNGSMNLSMVVRVAEAAVADEQLAQAYGIPALVRTHPDAPKA